MKNGPKISTLADVIKQKIRKRIYIALFVILLIPLILFIYAYYLAINIVKSEINSEVTQLADNIMGQYLVDNFNAIKLNIISINSSHPNYQVEWIALPLKKIKIPTFNYGAINFTAKYPVFYDVGGQNVDAGQLLVRCKLTFLIYKRIFAIIILCIIICGFTLLLYLLLIPLAYDIPNHLIVQPMQSLIKLMHTDENNDGDISVNNTYEEFQQIDQQIRQLFVVVKKQENNLAFMTISRKVIHDIKSPLKTALSCNHKLYKEGGLNNNLIRKIDRSLHNIHSQLGQLYKNIGKREAIGEENNHQPCHILFKSYIQEVIADKIIEQNKIIEVLVDTTGIHDDLWVFVEPYIFINHISNLLNNAYEAVENKNNNAIIKAKLSEEMGNHRLICEISDNGCGMDDDMRQKVVNGYTTKENGSGIGLSSANNYFKEIGGDLSIKSTLNAGTMVIIEVPISEPPIWFKEITLSNYVVVLDDDYEIHALLQTVLQNVPEVRYFTQVARFKQWYEDNTSHLGAVTYFIDNQIECRDKLGVDLINSYKINHQAFLMTDDYDDSMLQQKVINLNIRMIPKQLFKTIFKEELCCE